MLLFRVFIVAICAFLLSFSGQKAFAADSGVIKLELPDAAAAGMGGAFTGEADRPSAVYYNPAGITQMDTIEASAGLTLLAPQVEFKPTGGGVSSQMNRDTYAFPHVYVTTPVIKDKLYVGIGENSNFGAGNDWGSASFAKYSTVKDSFTNKDYTLAAAYKVDDQLSLGAEAIYDDSLNEHDVAINNQIPGDTDGDALFKSHDIAWGFGVAGMFKLNDQNQFGLSYKSPIHHTYDGTLYMNGLDIRSVGATFGGTSFTTQAIQKFTLPQSVTLGYSLKPTSKWTINADLEWTDWSNTKQQSTYYPNVTPTQAAALATNNPTQRSWRSVWAESLGVQYALRDNFRMRVGFDHHQSPIPKSTIDTDFPDANYNAYTVGFGYDITKNITFDIAYVAAVYSDRSEVNANNSSLNGKYSEFVSIGSATLTYKF